MFQINIIWFKNPNWREADQLAIYKHDWGVKPGSTETSGFQFQRPNHSATLSCSSNNFFLSSSTYSSLLIYSPLSGCYVPCNLGPLLKGADYHRTSHAFLHQPHRIWCKRSRMTTRPSFHRLKLKQKGNRVNILWGTLCICWNHIYAQNVSTIRLYCKQDKTLW